MEPPDPLFLYSSLSLSLPLPFSFSLLIPALARGLTALSVPACQKGPVIQHPPSGTGGKHAHTHTHTRANVQTCTLAEHAFTTDNTHPHTSRSRTHANIFFPKPTEYLHIQKLPTALRGRSACCQPPSKYADILHALIRIKCIIHTDTNLLSLRLFP